MNLREARQVVVRTHHAAVREGRRAYSYELVSGPGVGKSSIVEDAAADLARLLGRPVGLMLNMLATMSQPDVRGFMLPSKQPDDSLVSVFSQSPLMPRRDNIAVYEPDTSSPLGVKRWALGTWPADRPIPDVGVSFLDEFGQAEDEVKKPAADYVLKGQVGDNILPPGWRVLCASNRISDRSGVVRPLMHIVNRRAQLDIHGSYAIWNEDFVQRQPPEQRPHYLTVSFAQQNPHIVFREETPIDGKPFCTPRTLCMLDAELQALRGDDTGAGLPVDDLSREVMASWIGDGDAAQLIVHCKYVEVIPTIESVVASPSEAKLPPGMDGQMVCAHMLSHAVGEKNARRVMQYIGRMNVEMQSLFVRNVTSQPTAGAVLNTPEFQAWIAKYKDLIIASRS